LTQRARASRRTGPWTKLDSERRNALLLYAGIGGIILFALGIIALGYYDSRIKPAHQTVLRVGDKKFDVSFLQRRMKSQILTGSISNSGTFRDLASSTLSTIQQEELTRQSADGLGVVVTDSDIDNAIKNAGGLFTGAPQDQFAAVYRAQILRVGLPVSEYRDLMKAQVIQQKYTEKVLASPEQQAPQARMHIIEVSAQSKALEIAGRLKNGEGFDNIAVKESIHPSKASGGDVGWVIKGELPPEVDAVAANLPLNTTSDVIEAPEGFFVVVVNDREPMRDVDGNQKGLVAKQGLDRALADAKKRLAVQSTLSEDQIAFIARKIAGTRPTQQQQPVPPFQPQQVPVPGAPDAAPPSDQPPPSPPGG